jgi:hypothetical protein
MSLPRYDARGVGRGIDESPVTLPGLVGALVLAMLLAALILPR